MGTEVRIGIATGLLIVVVAGVYFFYGSNRDAKDLTIATEPTAISAPKIPPQRDVKPGASPKRATPGFTASDTRQRPTPAAGNRPAAPATIARNNPPRTPTTATPSQARPTVSPTPSNGALASNNGANDSLTMPVRPAASATTPQSNLPQNGIQSQPNLTAPPTGQLAANTPTGGASAPENAGPTVLRTMPSTSLMEATRRNLESADKPTPDAEARDAASNGSTAAPVAHSPANQDSPLVVQANPNRASQIQPRPADSSTTSIKLPPSLQPAGPRPSATTGGVTPANNGPSPVTGRPGPGSPMTAQPEKSAAPAWPRSHTIASGETLSVISTKYYNTAQQVDRILKANPSLNPRRLKIGDVISIPAPEGTAAVAAAVPATGTRAQPAEQTIAAVTGATAARTYTVRDGDTLYSIAQRVLGDSRKWKPLFEMNRTVLKNDPKRLKSGMVLTLP